MPLPPTVTAHAVADALQHAGTRQHPGRLCHAMRCCEEEAVNGGYCWSCLTSPCPYPAAGFCWCCCRPARALDHRRRHPQPISYANSLLSPALAPTTAVFHLTAKPRDQPLSSSLLNPSRSIVGSLSPPRWMALMDTRKQYTPRSRPCQTLFYNSRASTIFPVLSSQ